MYQLLLDTYYLLTVWCCDGCALSGTKPSTCAQQILFYFVAGIDILSS